MGWSCTWGSYSTATERKAYLDNHVYTWSNGSNTLLKSAMVGSVYYAAIRCNKTGEVWASVCLTTNSKKDNEFCYKDMDETAGPVESKCPTGILNLLTPTDSEYALKWRERCRAYHKNKSTTVVKIGDKVEFSESWSCAGVAEIVNKIKSSFILTSGSFGRFKVSAASMNGGINSGSIKLV